MARAISKELLEARIALRVAELRVIEAKQFVHPMRALVDESLRVRIIDRRQKRRRRRPTTHHSRKASRAMRSQ